MDIDKELEKRVAELMPVPQDDGPDVVKRSPSVADIKLLPHVAAALLRTRKALAHLATVDGQRRHYARAALADTELEEALK